MAGTVVERAIMEPETLASQRILFPKADSLSESPRKTSLTQAPLENNLLETTHQHKGDPGVTVTHEVSVPSV